MPLPLGKVPADVLQRYVLPYAGLRSSDLVVGPMFGLDFAVAKLGRRYIIISSDPITGAISDIGWYAVNVSANDVATSGARPRFLESVVLLPEGAEVQAVKEIATQIDSSARTLGMAVAGGHTEVTPGIRRPIVVTTAIGMTQRFVTAAGAKEGDDILVTKTIGIEGTSILASLFRSQLAKVDNTVVERAARMLKNLSVVEEGVTAFATGLVHAMHDATEGGVLGGIFETAAASGLGFEVVEKDFPIAPETRTICEALAVDPLKLISSGTLIIACGPRATARLVSALAAKGIRATKVGRFVKDGGTLVRFDDSIEKVDHGVLDELWRVLGRDARRVAELFSPG